MSGLLDSTSYNTLSVPVIDEQVTVPFGGPSDSHARFYD